MIYPKKKPKAGFGLDLGQLKLKEGLSTAAPAIGSLGTLAGGLIKKAGTRDLGYGVKDTSGVASVLGSSVSGAARGAELGGSFGPAGLLIGGLAGAAVGGLTGAFDALKNDRESAFRKRDALEMQAVTDRNNEGVSFYNSLEEKQLMQQGGELPAKGGEKKAPEAREEAVVLGGKFHREGGNDILDSSGAKVAETEREELLFTGEQTEQIERSIAIIDAGNGQEYLHLGSYVRELILNRTRDESGKFNRLNDDPSTDQR